MSLTHSLQHWWLDAGQKRAGEALARAVQRIGDLETGVQLLSDDRLREKFHALPLPESGRWEGEPLWLAFALIREACFRSVGKRPYDVQIMAGLAMARGTIAEMATGEGKTLVAALPACVLALGGKGVHVATVNEYLAKRDFELMRPIYEFLGLSVGLLPDQGKAKDKKAAYAADVTYGTGYEFGFDFLRDQLGSISRERPKLGDRWKDQLLGRDSPDAEPVQRPFACAVIDEIDSVLIDEAITPLIISRAMNPGENPHAAIYRKADEVASGLEKDHYEIREWERFIRLTREGMSRVYEKAPATALPLKRAWHEYVEQALRAQHLFKRDVHYLCKKGAVEIIDENTGRSFPDRKWRGGLHQAVEAKENLTIGQETESDVSICRQRFYRLYPFLCGMSGTVREEAVEFRDVYGLEIVAIPRNRPLRRKDLPDRVFATEEEKFDAVCAEVVARHVSGQPVLIGTRTVRQSEALSARLTAAGISHQLLNAKQDEEEADIIHRAGELGAVTLATNMAGRGADIPLGEGSAERGGLHVIGVERNEAGRIDRQLIGRSGRQGDPGSSQFFISIEDEIPQRFGSGWSDKAKGELDAKLAEKVISCQKRGEQEARERRQQVMQDDVWMDKLKRHFR